MISCKDFGLKAILIKQPDPCAEFGHIGHIVNIPFTKCDQIHYFTTSQKFDPTLYDMIKFTYDYDMVHIGYALWTNVVP